jgi:hypothetical protein
MADTTRLRQAVIDRTLKGDGKSAADQRRAAYDLNKAALAEPVRALIEKVARHAYKVTDEDVASAKAAGVSEDELFELVVCAALGQASRQLDAAYNAIVAAERGLAAPTKGVV